MGSENGKLQSGVASAGAWWIHARFNGLNVDEMTHRQWLEDHSAPGDIEHVHFERMIESGRSWDVQDTTLGRPLPVFQSPFSGPGKMEVRRPVLNREYFRLGMDLGDRVRSVREITVIDRSACLYLFQEFPFDAFSGTWGQDDFVRLKVSKGSRFYFMYLTTEPGEPDEMGAAGFKQRFDALPDERRTITLRQMKHTPESEDWRWPSTFYIRRAADSDRWFWMYVAREEDGPGLLPAARNAAPPELRSEQMPTYFMFPRDGARSEYVWGDELYGFVQLLYPAGAMRLDYTEAAEQEGYWVRAEYRYAWAATQLVDKVILSAPGKHTDPLVKLVDGVRARTYMSVAPQDDEQLVWEMLGEQHGRLEAQGRGCWYCPPAAPDVEYIESEKTLRPCVRKGARFEPVSIDRVVTGTPGKPLTSTYVILNARPTHYFRLEERGFQLGLILCYQGRGNSEVVVPTADIDWRVLAGGGTVTQDGTFKPGLEERFSVVLAIEKDDRSWYWAVIILPLPMKSPQGFITMSNATV